MSTETNEGYAAGCMAGSTHKEPWIRYAAQILAGAHGSGPGEYGGSSSLSTYGSLEDFIRDHGPEIEPGAWIVDGRRVLERDAYHVAIAGPMVDATADPMAVWDGSRFTAPDGPIVDMIAAGWGATGLLELQRAREGTAAPGPLDMVPPMVKALEWEGVGARIGRWDGRRVVWFSDAL